jgi:hypothetical protein
MQEEVMDVKTMLLDVRIKVKVKQSHYRLMEPRGFWDVKASRFRVIGT